MTITENGLTAFDDVVTACRPWYPGHENSSVNVKGFLWHSVETPTIAPHWMAGPAGSNGGLLGIDWMNKVTTEASVHFGTDVSDIVQCGPLDRGCWGCGNGNAIFIQTEQSGNAAMSRDQWTSPGGMIQLNNSAKLAAALHRNFPDVPVKWATDAEILAAYNGGPPCGHAYHDDASRVLGGSSHTDPTPNWPGKLPGDAAGQDFATDLFLPLVRQYLGVTPTPIPTPIPVGDDFMSALTPDEQRRILAAADALMLSASAAPVPPTSRMHMIGDTSGSLAPFVPGTRTFSDSMAVTYGNTKGLPALAAAIMKLVHP